MESEHRILITSSGSKGVPGLIKDLKKSGDKFYIITADINSEAIGNIFADKWYTVPPWDSDEYIPAIMDIVERERIKNIIPNDGPSGLLKLSKLSIENNELKIAVTKNIEHLNIALNKFKLFKYLQTNSMQNYVPKYTVVSDPRTLLKTVTSFGYPEQMIAIKPCVSEGSRGFWIVSNYKRNIFKDKGRINYLSYEELEFYLKDISEIPEILVMEYLSGEEYSVDVLINKNRKIEYIIPRVRDQVAEGISIKGTVKKNTEVERLVIEILKKLELIYACNVQIKYSKEGVPKVMEINPRVSGTMTFCTGVGVNYHYFLILIMADRPLPKAQIKYGTKMYRYYEEKYLYE